MQQIDYSQPIEVYKGDPSNPERIVSAQVGMEWNGAGPPPIWTQGALFSVSENFLRRIGYGVRNK